MHEMLYEPCEHHFNLKIKTGILRNPWSWELDESAT